MDKHVYLVMRMCLEDYDVVPVGAYENILDAMTAAHNLGTLDKHEEFSYFTQPVNFFPKQKVEYPNPYPVRFDGDMGVDQSLQSMRENIPA